MRRACVEQCVVDGEDQVGHHLPQQDGTLVILPIAETHGDQCAKPDELVKYVHPSFLLNEKRRTPCRMRGEKWRRCSRKIHTYFGVLLYHGTAVFVNCGKGQPPKAMGFWRRVVRPTGFEPAAFRVGVIRPSSRNPPRRNGLIEIAQIFGILKKNLGRLAAQGFRGFSR